MKKIIIHTEDLNLEGEGILRNAVRAVVHRDDRILMVYSPVNGDYKFPGGGIEAGETHDQALVREVREECGMDLGSIDDILAVMTEYSAAKEEDKEFFAMESFYYECRLESERLCAQNLDDYERELAFTPEWVTLAKAIETNRKVLAKDHSHVRWVVRDTRMLEYLKDKPRD